MKASFIHWLRGRKSLFRYAKKARSVYILIHNKIHRDNLRRKTKTPLFSKTKIGEGTDVHPSAFICMTGVRIGRNCKIGPSAIILEKSIIEDEVEIGTRAVIGSEGFVFDRGEGKTVMVRQTGGVRIGKGSIVGADSCIDRATFRGRTDIGEGVRIDRFVHLAHNVRIGALCKIGGHSMIAGNVNIGDEADIGQNVSVSQYLDIGRKSRINDSAIVTKSVAEGHVLEGGLAEEYDQYRKSTESARRLRV